MTFYTSNDACLQNCEYEKMLAVCSMFNKLLLIIKTTCKRLRKSKFYNKNFSLQIC